MKTTHLSMLLSSWAEITQHKIGPLLMDGAHSAIFLCAGEDDFRRIEYYPLTGSVTITAPNAGQIITSTMMVELFKQAVPDFSP